MKHNIETTITLPDDRDESVSVEFHYSPGAPEVRSVEHGCDSPGEAPEVEIISVTTLSGEDVTDLVDERTAESIRRTIRSIRNE